MIHITAKAHHARIVAQNLRTEDQRELALACPGRDPVEVVLGLWVDSIVSKVFLTDDGRCAAVWGVYPVPGHPGVGSIWLVATPAIKDIALPFLRECHRSIDGAHDHFPVLVCTPWRENSLHLKWLQWCGFTPTDMGHEHFIAYSHVRTPSGASHHAGGHCGVSCDAEQPAEQGNRGSSQEPE